VANIYDEQSSAGGAAEISAAHPIPSFIPLNRGMFHAWMEIFRPGSLFVPVVRVLNGNRQDAETGSIKNNVHVFYMSLELRD
jgi:hypothetical protein